MPAARRLRGGVQKPFVYWTNMAKFILKYVYRLNGENSAGLDDVFHAIARA